MKFQKGDRVEVRRVPGLAEWTNGVTGTIKALYHNTDPCLYLVLTDNHGEQLFGEPTIELSVLDALARAAE